MAATTIGKTAVMLGLDSSGFDTGIDKAKGKMNGIGKEADRMSKGTGLEEPGAEVESGAKGTSIKSMKKAFKSIAKDAAFVEMGVEAITKAFGQSNKPLKQMLDMTKEIALGWAVGGPIGAGVTAILGVINRLGGGNESDEMKAQKKEWAKLGLPQDDMKRFGVLKNISAFKTYKEASEKLDDAIQMSNMTDEDKYLFPFRKAGLAKFEIESLRERWRYLQGDVAEVAERAEEAAAAFKLFATESVENMFGGGTQSGLMDAFDRAAEEFGRHIEKESESFAKGLKDQTSSPLEKMHSQIEKLDDAKRRGFITDRQYAAGLYMAAEAAGALGKELEIPSLETAGEEGSAGAIRAINAAYRAVDTGGQGGGLQEGIQRLVQLQNEANGKQDAMLAEWRRLNGANVGL